MDIPTLRTPRLLMRALCEKDFETYATICADEDSMRYMGGKTLPRAEAWRKLVFLLGHWHIRGYGMWAVVESATEQFVGMVGFHQPEGWPGFEIGWQIHPQHWGKGYAPEAASAALPLARSHYGQDHVISLILPENSASIRVAEKIGETREAEIDFRDMRVLRYGVSLK